MTAKRDVSYGRTVTHTLDGRSRLSGVADNLGIGVTWDFDAGNRRELAHLSNGIESAFAYDLNNRLTRVTHADNVALLDPFHDVEHRYDPVGNLIWSKDHVSSDRSRLYAYDQRHRLVQFERGVLDTQTPAITTPSSDPVLPNSQSWLGSGGENLLDRRGNWTGFRSQINTSLAEQTRELDTTDKQNAGVNEYDRSMTRIGNQWVYEEFTYDDNGNLIAIDMVGDVNCDGVTDFNDNNVFILLLTDPQQYALDYPDCSGELGDVNNNGSVGFDDINGFVDLLTNLGDGEARRYDYDDENRLIAVKEYDGTLITEYAYDALGRRIEVTDHVSTADMCGDSTSPVRTRQVYSGLATIQEYVWCATAGEWTAAREFLYGASFLEPVALVDWSDLGDEQAGTEEVLHYVHDRLGSVVALTDAGDPDATPTPIPPKAVERYEYDPYGQTYVEVWDESLNGGAGGWASATESKYGNALLWTAQRYDATVDLYHFPARAYSPRLGRWLQRDPLGYVDGVNLYEYVRSAATTLIDPMGLMLGWRPPGGSMPSPGDYVAHDDGYGGNGWHPPWLPPDDDPMGDDGIMGPPTPDPCPDGDGDGPEPDPVKPGDGEDAPPDDESDLRPDELTPHEALTLLKKLLARHPGDYLVSSWASWLISRIKSDHNDWRDKLNRFIKYYYSRPNRHVKIDHHKNKLTITGEGAAGGDALYIGDALDEPWALTPMDVLGWSAGLRPGATLQLNMCHSGESNSTMRSLGERSPNISYVRGAKGSYNERYHPGIGVLWSWTDDGWHTVQVRPPPDRPKPNYPDRPMGFP